MLDISLNHTACFRFLSVPRVLRPLMDGRITCLSVDGHLLCRTSGPRDYQPTIDCAAARITLTTCFELQEIVLNSIHYLFRAFYLADAQRQAHHV